MNLYPKKDAERHYEKLVALHNFEYLTYAQKVIIFLHDLEHDILKKITGKNDFFEQLNSLRNEQVTVKHNVKSGNIPKHYISDLENLKNWRNEGTHENNMPEAKYKSHFYTMAQIIKFFSNIHWTIEIENIINYNMQDNIQNIETKKITFKLVENEDEICKNIKKYINILKNEPNSKIVENFSSVTYWYYLYEFISVQNKLPFYHANSKL